MILVFLSNLGDQEIDSVILRYAKRPPLIKISKTQFLICHDGGTSDSNSTIASFHSDEESEKVSIIIAEYLVKGPVFNKTCRVSIIISYGQMFPTSAKPRRLHANDANPCCWGLWGHAVSVPNGVQ